MLATIGHFGEDAYLDYWADLRDNGVLVSDGWEDAYWGQFSGASEGDRPLVVSYATSPPVEVYYGELDESPTGSIVAPDTCFRQIEFVGILKGTPAPKASQELVDFLLGTAFQEDLPLQMFMFPADPDAALPDIFVEHASVPDQPIVLDPAAIESNRETWIEDWTDVVLR
jgi:thiamine transport system substrate-binding protein